MMRWRGVRLCTCPGCHEWRWTRAGLCWPCRLTQRDRGGLAQRVATDAKGCSVATEGVA